MRRLPATRVSLLSSRARLDAVLEACRTLSLPLVSVQTWRSVRLGKARALRFPGSPSPLDEAPASLLRAWVQPGSESALMESLRLAAAQRGPGGLSLWAESVDLIHHGIESLPVPPDSPAASSRSGPLSGIVCIVPRGEGNQVARLVLGMGLSAPMIGYGRGMGLRNKLGLIRVTIPAGKEIVLFLCQPHDAPEALSLLRDALGLAEVPGKAFLYAFPVQQGMADSLISPTESLRHVASMEQVISAIDELSGSPAWRRRSSRPAPARAEPPPEGAQRLSCLSLSCLEGQAEEHIQSAMDLGAAGATLSRTVSLGWNPQGAPLPREAREASDIILPSVLVEPILDALAFSGFFSADARGMAELGPVERVAAYRSQK